MGTLTERIAVVVSGKDEGAVSTLTKTGTAAEKSGKQVVTAQDNAARSTSRTAAAIRTAMIPAAVAGGAAVVAFGKKSVDAFVGLASEVRNFSRITGASAEESSRFVAALDDLQVSSETAAKGVAKLARVDPNALKAFNVEVARSADGNINLTETLLNVADAYVQTDDPARKLQLAFAAFGKSGTELIPVLEKGRAGLQDFFDAGDRQIFSQDDLDKARSYELAVDNLQDAIGGVSRAAGSSLVPALTAAADAATTVLHFAQGIPGPVRTAAVSFGLLAGSALVVRKAFGGIASGVLDRLSVGFDDLSLSQSGYVKSSATTSGAGAKVGRALALAGAAVGPLNIALGAGAIALGIYAQKKAEARARVEEFTAAIEADGGAVKENTRQLIVSKLEQSGALKVAGDLGIALEDVTAATLGNAQAQARVAEAIRGHNDEAFALIAAVTNVKKELDEGAAAAGRQKTALEETGKGYVIVGDSSVEATTHLNRFGETVDDVTGKIKDQKTGYERLNGEIDKYNSKNLDAEEANIAFLNSLESLRESVKENGKSLTETTQKGRDNRTAFLEAAKAAQELGARIGDKKGFNAGRASLIDSRQRLVELGKQLGLSKTEVDKLIKSVFNIPRVYRSEIDLKIAAAQKRAAEIQKRITQVRGKQVEVRVTDAGTIEKVVRDIRNIGGRQVVVEVRTGGGAGRGGTTRMSKGGEVTGGVPGQDSVPALLMPGERVLTVAENRAYKLRLRAPQPGPAAAPSVTVAAGAVQLVFNGPVDRATAGNVRREVDAAFSELTRRIVAGSRV